MVVQRDKLARTRSVARVAYVDDRMAFEIGIRWILLLSVTSWIVVASLVF